MNKTKLGLSPKTYACLTFLAAIMGIIPALLMAGIILVTEENYWLRRSVTKAVIFVIFMSLLGTLVGCLSNFTDIIYNIVSIFNGSISMETLREIISLFNNVIYLVTDVCLIVFAYTAGNGKYVQIPVIDAFVDGNM